MITYIKGNQVSNLENDGTMGKLRIHIDNTDYENIWVKTIDNQNFLQNHAVNFYPFPSWGALVPNNGNLKEMRDSKIFTLHPDAYDSYLKEGVIDADGKFIQQPEEKDEEDIDSGSSTTSSQTRSSL